VTHRILVVEDEANYRRVLAMMVVDLDVELLEAADGEAALALLDRETVDLVISDLNMPRMDGMALLRALRTRPSPPPVVIITAYGSIDSAVEAMRAGAIDYLPKPFDEQRLHLTLKRALRVTDLLAENRRLRDAVEARYDFSLIVGESEALMAALNVAGKVAASDVAVLVRGESGTGKELVARAIHYNSRRAGGPFIAVNCAALPENLLEAELFGAEAGAYTGATRRRRGRFELARGGTLFLDEIGDMPLPLQAKILRVVQERRFTPLGAEREQPADLRFVFATNRDLEAMVQDGGFRQDLFYRVSVVPVRLPPLRERGDDWRLLTERFIATACEAMGRSPMRLSAAAEAALAAYAFPGNVRELANLIERAVILTDGDVIDAGDIALGPARAAASAGGLVGAGGAVRLPPSGVDLEAVERELVRQALERTGGNKSQAARLLGLSRATLRYRVEKLGL